MKRLSLDLPFKGQRTYLHGTDMYEETLTALRRSGRPMEGKLRLRIGRVTSSAVDLLIVDRGEPPTRPAGEAASLAVGDTTAFLVVTDRPVTRRTPYDESAAEKTGVLDCNTIRLPKSVGLTAIETVVAITRMLHRTRLPSTDRHWMFTGLDLVRPLVPSDIAGMSVALETTLGVALTKSAITAGSGESLGHIYFSLVQS